MQTVIAANLSDPASLTHAEMRLAELEQRGAFIVQRNLLVLNTAVQGEPDNYNLAPPVEYVETIYAIWWVSDNKLEQRQLLEMEVRSAKTVSS